MEKQWVKLASSCVMGLKHCIVEEGGFLNTLFKIPVIFCHWLSEINQKKTDEVRSVLIVLINTLHLLVIQVLDLKTEEKFFYSYLDSSEKNY